MPTSSPRYLQPYLSAASKYGAGFGTLLWASPKTQALRFDALLRAANVSNKRVLDVGCGRADLFEHMLKQKRYPKTYLGLEAVEELATAAEKKIPAIGKILRGDFLADPSMWSTTADIVLISGSLNTMDRVDFFSCLQTAYDAADEALVFNFLCSPLLASSSHLTWHEPAAVLAFARSLSPRVKIWDDYLRGDATVAMYKDHP